MTQVATPGRIVLYTLSEQDADRINKRRQAIQERGEARTEMIGNTASPQQVYPAVVVRTFGGPNVNLQVLLDGSDTFWATSRAEGDGPGQWHWPPRV